MCCNASLNIMLLISYLATPRSGYYKCVLWYNVAKPKQAAFKHIRIWWFFAECIAKSSHLRHFAANPYVSNGFWLSALYAVVAVCIAITIIDYWIVVLCMIRRGWRFSVANGYACNFRFVLCDPQWTNALRWHWISAVYVNFCSNGNVMWIFYILLSCLYWMYLQLLINSFKALLQIKRCPFCVFVPPESQSNSQSLLIQWL